MSRAEMSDELIGRCVLGSRSMHAEPLNEGNVLEHLRRQGALAVKCLHQLKQHPERLNVPCPAKGQTRREQLEIDIEHGR